MTNFQGGFDRITRVNRNGPQIIIKPTCLTKYNQYKSGIDRSDQYGSYYSYSHRSYKWWKKIFMNLVETSLLNFFIIYKDSSPLNSGMTFLDFRKEAMRNIYTMLRKDIPQQLRNALSLNHTLEKQNDKRNCKVCSKRENRRQTSYKCPACNFYCHPECFVNLHIKPIVYRNKD